jgi:uncharacterized protein YjbI with pentapeptide repeats
VPRRPVKSVRRVAPRLTTPGRPGTLPDDDIVDDALLRGLSWSDADLTDRTARLVDIEECRLTGCRLAGSDIEKLTITDSELVRCDLANVTLREAALNRVVLDGCRLTGAVWSAATLRHVGFVDCVGDLSSFRFTSCLALTFVDCRLHRADFGSTDLRGARFERCDLTGVDFSQVSADKAVFLDCTWEGVRGIANLSGAVVANASPMETLTFTARMAGALGITLADPSDLADDPS